MKKIKSKEKCNCIEILQKCFRLITKYSKTFIPITIVISILQSLLPSVSLIIMQNIINLLQAETVGIQKLIFFSVLYLGIDMFQEISNILYSLYYTKFSYKFDKNIKVILFEKSICLELSDYENSETYDIIDRAKSQNGQDILNFYNLFINIMSTCIKIITSVLIICQFNIFILPIILVFPIFKYLYLVKIGKHQYNLQVMRTSEERKLWYIDYLIMTGNAYKELTLYNIGKKLIEEYKEKKENFNSIDIGILKKASKVEILLTAGDLIVYSGSVVKT